MTEAAPLRGRLRSGSLRSPPLRRPRRGAGRSEEEQFTEQSLHRLRRARFAVLRDAVMPAVLIEAGFMSHPVEGRKIFSSAYRQKIARAIVEGVLAYKKAVEQAT
jgi:hypothetical protein